MARNFGSASTDRLKSTLTAHATLRTYAIWAYRVGNGGGGFGRMFEKQVSGGQSELLLNQSTRYDYVRQRSGGASTWGFTRPAVNEWHHVGVTYDSALSANDPVMYLDGVAQSLAADSNASGSVTDNADNYVIGNRENDNARNWDGYLAEFAVWDLIQPADVMAALGKGYSPLFFPQGLVEYLPIVREPISRVRSAPTLTGTAVIAHPRIYSPAAPLIVTAPAAAVGGLAWKLVGRRAALAGHGGLAA